MVERYGPRGPHERHGESRIPTENLEKVIELLEDADAPE
jgi:hypothetical protein